MSKDKRVNHLLKKFVEKKISESEGQELFELLKDRENTTGLEEIFTSTWKSSSEFKGKAPIDWNSLQEEKALKGKLEKRAKILRLGKWVAAASVLLLTVVFIGNFQTKSPDMVFHTNYGEIENIVLEDGTEVVLNANSTLKWNTSWKENNARVVELKGEAFFKVTHIDKENLPVDRGEAIPFTVVTNDLEVKVLGTSFNVFNRRGGTDVFLEEGLVELELNNDLTDLKDVVTTGEGQTSLQKSMLMKPGELVSFSAERKILNKENIDSNSPSVWKDGTLTFDNVEVGQVLIDLQDVYGKTFVVEDSTILMTEVSFGIPYKDWSTVKNLMELTLDIEIENIDENQIRITKPERVKVK